MGTVTALAESWNGIFGLDCHLGFGQVLTRLHLCVGNLDEHHEENHRLLG